MQNYDPGIDEYNPHRDGEHDYYDAEGYQDWMRYRDNVSRIYDPRGEYDPNMVTRKAMSTYKSPSAKGKAWAVPRASHKAL